MKYVWTTPGANEPNLPSLEGPCRTRININSFIILQIDLYEAESLCSSAQLSFMFIKDSVVSKGWTVNEKMEPVVRKPTHTGGSMH